MPFVVVGEEEEVEVYKILEGAARCSLFLSSFYGEERALADPEAA